MPIQVMGLCEGNSNRSPMFEGAGRSLGGEDFSFSSAGRFSTRVDKTAIAVMKEIDIDISRQHSKGLDEGGFFTPDGDVVVDLTEEGMHWQRYEERDVTYLNIMVPDPVWARNLPLEERLPEYRQCRDRIMQIVRGLITILRQEGGLETLRAMKELEFFVD